MATKNILRLEDFNPYIIARSSLPIGLYGPSPPPVRKCICGKFIIDDLCLCASSCSTMPKYIWAKENPSAYNAEQNMMARWNIVLHYWIQQKIAVDYHISKTLYPYIQMYHKLLDAQSSIGCATCENYGKEYCVCYDTDDDYDYDSY